MVERHAFWPPVCINAMTRRAGGCGDNALQGPLPGSSPQVSTGLLWLTTIDIDIAVVGAGPQGSPRRSRLPMAALRRADRAAAGREPPARARHAHRGAACKLGRYVEGARRVGRAPAARRAAQGDPHHRCLGQTASARRTSSSRRASSGLRRSATTSPTPRWSKCCTAQAAATLPLLQPSNVDRIELDAGPRASAAASEGWQISARLVVGADGRHSICREAAQIGATDAA